MKPTVYEELTSVLKREPLPLSRAHALTREWGSVWSKDQLQLFLACMDGVELDTTIADPIVRLGQRTPEELLTEAIVQVVKSQTKPIPAGQVVKLLPSQFVTTEAQVRALAKTHPDLEVMGPGLLRIKH
jgi:hypothetical protein